MKPVYFSLWLLVTSLHAQVISIASNIWSDGSGRAMIHAGIYNSVHSYDYRVLQVFQPTHTGFLNSIDFTVWGIVKEADLRVSVYTINDMQPVSLLRTTVIAASSIAEVAPDFAGDFNASAKYDGALLLQQGKSYGVMFSTDTGNSLYSISINSGLGAVYSDGALGLSTFLSPFNYSNHMVPYPNGNGYFRKSDLCFNVSATAIPEPCSSAMMIGGFVVMLLLVRRRRDAISRD